MHRGIGLRGLSTAHLDARQGLCGVACLFEAERVGAVGQFGQDVSSGRVRPGCSPGLCGAYVDTFQRWFAVADGAFDVPVAHLLHNDAADVEDEFVRCRVTVERKVVFARLPFGRQFGCVCLKRVGTDHVVCYLRLLFVGLRPYPYGHAFGHRGPVGLQLVAHAVVLSPFHPDGWRGQPVVGRRGAVGVVGIVGSGQCCLAPPGASVSIGISHAPQVELLLRGETAGVGCLYGRSEQAGGREGRSARSVGVAGLYGIGILSEGVDRFVGPRVRCHAFGYSDAVWPSHDGVGQHRRVDPSAVHSFAGGFPRQAGLPPVRTGQGYVARSRRPVAPYKRRPSLGGAAPPFVCRAHPVGGPSGMGHLCVCPFATCARLGIGQRVHHLVASCHPDLGQCAQCFASEGRGRVRPGQPGRQCALFAGADAQVGYFGRCARCRFFIRNVQAHHLGVHPQRTYSCGLARDGVEAEPGLIAGPVEDARLEVERHRLQVVVDALARVADGCCFGRVFVHLPQLSVVHVQRVELPFGVAGQRHVFPFVHFAHHVGLSVGQVHA